jgi:hypothetical protein
MPTKGAKLLLTRWECVLLMDILEEYVEGKEESNETKRALDFVKRIIAQTGSRQF